MKKHILGFPRMGADRELKKALESFWKGKSSREELEETARVLRQRHWQVQKDAGLSYVATGDFSYYDHMLDMTATLGMIPRRFGPISGHVDPATYFNMARGDAEANLPAMEMTKWFNTNYHYLVPEISSSSSPSLSSTRILDQTREAIEAGFAAKPVLVGPITYLSLAKGADDYDVWKQLEAVVEVYAGLIAELGALADWIQIDEPILCTDLSPGAREAFLPSYEKLNAAKGKSKLLLATYFESLDDHLDLATSSGCEGLHLDLISGNRRLETILERLPESMTLSAGLVDGRNIWKTDLSEAITTLRALENKIGNDRLMVGSSCSLLHCPVDLEKETSLEPELKRWMAFSVQKCEELRILGEACEGKEDAKSLAANSEDMRSRRDSSRVTDPAVRDRCEKIEENMLSRKSPYPSRKGAQAWLELPLFPTTTIGSYPQTREIRAQRRKFKKGEISREAYEAFLQEEIRRVVEFQEECGLDVLVHGEPERNDMVEYFGQQMNGFCFTDNGWVQSYGSRCVKPPIIFGDVSRPRPMTVEWMKYAQSLTKKPMKGMLTGPVTILAWSFVRDDMAHDDVCLQIALAIRDEVLDLEKAEIRMIQIDEAAFSEGMPLKQKDKPAYLRWAVDAFRLVTSGVSDETQIHTHMCYSEFNDILDSIAEMDADVISIESSRSKMELLEAFRVFDYPNEIGPGVYDIHSPRIPPEEEMVALLEKAIKSIPRERLWVNPDCGLKTRGWPEITSSLKNMVAAAKTLRKRHGHR
jgi:5-methyltetrahydropteroyltriglutamate--homocysteine methyltransferase